MILYPESNYGKIKLYSLALIIFLLIILYALNYNRIELINLIKIYKNIIYIILLLMIIEFLNYRISPYERLTIGNINSIWVGRIIGEGIIFVLFLCSNKKFKSIKYILIMFLLLGLISTGSKGPLFSLLLSMLTILFIKQKNNFNKEKILFDYIKILLSSLVGVFFFKYIVFNLFNKEFLLYRFFYSEIVYGENSRINLIKKAWEYFLKNPFFGNGLGSYGYLTYGFDIRLYPHNIIFEVLSELGIVGFLLITILIIITFIRYFKYSSKTDKFTNLIMSLFIYYLLNSFVSGDLGFYNSKLFFLMVVLNLMVKKSNTLHGN